jgi:hypothetical protein
MSLKRTFPKMGDNVDTHTQKAPVLDQGLQFKIERV